MKRHAWDKCKATEEPHGSEPTGLLCGGSCHWRTAHHSEAEEEDSAIKIDFAI